MKLVLMEAFIVSVIGIPIGLIAGTFAIDVVFKIIESFYKSSMIGELGLRVVYSPSYYIKCNNCNDNYINFSHTSSDTSNKNITSRSYKK